MPLKRRIPFLLLAFVLAACQKSSSPGDWISEGEPTDNRAYVAGCLTRTNSVETKVSSRTVTDGPYRWTTAPYTLTAQATQVTLNVAVNILWAPDVRDRQAARQRLVKVRDCSVGFFRKHGIDLRLNYNEVESNPHVTVRWRAHSKEFNAGHWALHLEDPYANEFEEVCSAVTHEFSHLLGLKDEYEDSACPARVLGEPDSIMKNCWSAPAAIRFHRRHLDTIIGPLCAGRSSTHSPR